MLSLLTVKQVAEKLNVSISTVKRMQEDGQIAFVKIGKCVRMREEHLENWIEKRTVKVKNNGPRTQSRIQPAP